jgi:hypothetical protein
MPDDAYEWSSDIIIAIFRLPRGLSASSKVPVSAKRNRQTDLRDLRPEEGPSTSFFQLSTDGTHTARHPVGVAPLEQL